MLVRETKIINEKTYIYTFSDEDFYIRQKDTELLYVDAHDLIDHQHEYEETDIKIGEEEEEGEEENET